MEKYVTTTLHQILAGAVEALGEKMNRYPEKAVMFLTDTVTDQEIIEQYQKDCTGMEGEFLHIPPVTRMTEEGDLCAVVYVTTGTPVKHYCLDTRREMVFDLDLFIAYQLGYIPLPTDVEQPASTPFMGKPAPAPTMGTAIRTVVTDKSVVVYSYYNDLFVRRARGLRGNWVSGAWNFTPAVLEHVKAAVLECFGVDGTAPYEVCTLLVKGLDTGARTEGVELFGRPIAKAYGRDSGAKPGDDIFLLSGSFSSGGSVKNWSTNVNDATFEIHNFPIAALKRADVQKAIEEGWCEIK